MNQYFERPLGWKEDIKTPLANPDVYQGQEDMNLISHYTPDELTAQGEPLVNFYDNKHDRNRSYFNAACAFAEKGGTHATGADVLELLLSGTIYDKPSGKFYRQKPGEIVYKPELRMISITRKILSQAAKDGRDNLESLAEPNELPKIGTNAGKALKNSENEGFLKGVLNMFAECVLPDTPDGAVPWNDTPECHAIKDGVLDLRGEKEIIRPLGPPPEYYNYEIPITRAEYEAADPWSIPAYDDFGSKLYVDPKTRETAEYCSSLLMGNRGTKFFIVHFGPLANNGKDTEHELKAELLPGRVKTIPSDLICEHGNEGINRFGTATLRQALSANVSELGTDKISISKVKNLTNGATIRGEEKGRQSFEFKQKAVLGAKTNVLPPFDPDPGFLNRLIFIPYNSCFYQDQEQKDRLKSMGVQEDHLFPQEDREKLFDPIIRERAGIIKRWAFLYMYLRDELNRKIPESKECREAKEKYRAANDMLEQFFIEYLVRRPEGSISNADLENLWDDFSSKSWGRGKLKEALAERFDFIKVKRLRTGWHLMGVSVREVSAQ